MKLKKGKTYYLPEDSAKIKYIGQGVDLYHIFEYIDHPEFEEYTTRELDGIYLNKKEYLEKGVNNG